MAGMRLVGCEPFPRSGVMMVMCVSGALTASQGVIVLDLSI